MIPQNLKTLSVTRNRNNQVVEFSVCDGTTHWCLVPPDIKQNDHMKKEKETCDGIACKEAAVEFPQDVVARLGRVFQVKLGLVKTVPVGRVLVVQTDDTRVAIYEPLSKTSFWDFENGSLLADKEYVFFPKANINSSIGIWGDQSSYSMQYCYNLSGKACVEEVFSWQFFIRIKLSKIRKKIAKLGLREYVQTDQTELVFQEKLEELRAKKDKLVRYPQTEKVFEAQRVIDETIALIVGLPQFEVEAHADDIAETELDDILRIRQDVLDRLDTSRQTWADIAKIEQQNAPLLEN